MNTAHFQSGREESASHRARGFSLIEILISILILALGLLGLGALFPVIIREQRAATEQVSGVIAMNNLRAEILPKIKALSTIEQRIDRTSGSLQTTRVVVRYVGLATLLEPWRVANSTVSVPTILTRPERYGLWEPRIAGQLDVDADGALIIGAAAPNENLGADVTVSPAVGEFSQEWLASLRRANTLIAAPNNPVNIQALRWRDRVIVPLADRVGVSSGLEEGRPELVWDAVFRAVPRAGKWPISQYTVATARALQPVEMQAAVFVRRIDQRIRVEPGRTLRETLFPTGGPTTTTPFPVGADVNGDPTYDGTDGAGNGRYSGIIQAMAPDNFDSVQEVFGFNEPPDPSAGLSPEEWQQWRERQAWLEDVNIDSPIGRAIAQVGQKLVDNLGNVYTVERIELADNAPAGTNARRVRLNPAPSPEDVRVQNLAQMPTIRGRRIQQFVLTPQVPVAVFVETIPVPQEAIKP